MTRLAISGSRPQDFVTALNEVDAAAIELHLNTPGGDASTGWRSTTPSSTTPPP